MTIMEQIAHLKGLAEGLDIAQAGTKEARLLTAMLDVLDSMAQRVEDLDEEVEVLNDGMDAVSDELMDLEEDFYGGDDGTWPCDEDEDDEDEDEEDIVYLVQCPKCGEELEVDEDTLLEGTICCDACDQLFQLEIVEDEDEEDEDFDDEA